MNKELLERAKQITKKANACTHGVSVTITNQGVSFDCSVCGAESMPLLERELNTGTNNPDLEKYY